MYLDWYFQVLISIGAWFVYANFCVSTLSVNSFLLFIKSLFFIIYFDKMTTLQVLMSLEYIVLYTVFVIHKEKFSSNRLLLATSPLLVYICVNLSDSYRYGTASYETLLLFSFLLGIRLYYLLRLKGESLVLFLPISFIISVLVLNRFYEYSEVSAKLSWPLIIALTLSLIGESLNQPKKIMNYFFILILWAVGFKGNSILEVISLTPLVVAQAYIVGHKSSVSRYNLMSYLIILLFVGKSFWDLLFPMITWSTDWSWQIALIWVSLMGWLLVKMDIARKAIECVDKSKKIDYWSIALAVVHVFLMVGVL
jgi:hypothetical protein